MLNVLWKYHLLVSPSENACKMLVKVCQQDANTNYVCMNGLTLIATYAIQPKRRGANAEVAGHAVQLKLQIRAGM